MLCKVSEVEDALRIILVHLIVSRCFSVVHLQPLTIVVHVSDFPPANSISLIGCKLVEIQCSVWILWDMRLYAMLVHVSDVCLSSTKTELSSDPVANERAQVIAGIPRHKSLKEQGRPGSTLSALLERHGRLVAIRVDELAGLEHEAQEEESIDVAAQSRLIEVIVCDLKVSAVRRARPMAVPVQDAEVGVRLRVPLGSSSM
mmetsp:Transcript_38480/g.121223  ORF Transcript_38480/g.121223 Transcript_38480/m.121223 type:complete len:202 (+) Transcript_38480:923-1528(+)